MTSLIHDRELKTWLIKIQTLYFNLSSAGLEIVMHYSSFLSDNPTIHSVIHPFELSVHLTINAWIHLTIHPFIHPSIYAFIRPAIHSSIHSSIHPSIHPFIHSSFIYPSIHPSIHSTIHSSIHLTIHSFFHWSILHCPIYIHSMWNIIFYYFPFFRDLIGWWTFCMELTSINRLCSTTRTKEISHTTNAWIY